MLEFKQYKRKEVAELAKWEAYTDMAIVSVSVADKEKGSPKNGDMIARNPKNHDDKWLVAEKYFKENFEPVESTENQGSAPSFTR